MSKEAAPGQARELSREEMEKVAADSEALINQVWAQGAINGLREAGVGVPFGDDPASTQRRNTMLKWAFIAQQKQAIAKQRQESETDDVFAKVAAMADSILGVPGRNAASNLTDLDRADLQALAMDPDVNQAARNLAFLQDGR
jgi:hypothetical protein